MGEGSNDGRHGTDHPRRRGPAHQITIPAEVETNEHVLQEIKRVLDGALAGLPPTTQRLVRDFIEGRESVNTARAYATAMRTFLDWCRGRGIDPLAITKQQASLFPASACRQLAPRSVALRVGAVTSFFSTLIDWDVRDDNPFARVKVKNTDVLTPTPALTLRELEELLSTMAADFDDPARAFLARRDFTAIYLAARIGTRRIELFRMTWRDLRASRGTVTLRIHGKGGTTADTRLPDDVVEVLESWRAELTMRARRDLAPGDAVFPACHPGTTRLRIDRDGRVRPMALAFISQMVRGRMRDAGLEGERYSTHSLRATAATLAHESGASAIAIASLLRHRSLNTTRIYIKRATDAAHGAAASWRPSLGPTVGREPRVDGEAA